MLAGAWVLMIQFQEVLQIHTNMNKGFTLIELLIVVAIIGILAAVGAAVIPNLLTNAKIAAAKANHKTVVNFIKVNFAKCESRTRTNFKTKSHN